MQALFNLINVPLGFVLRFLSDLFGENFAAAVFVFTLLINLIMLPLSIKSQKSSVQQTRIKPKLDELKKRYGDDKQKYSEAMQTLYQEEGVSMSGGCLPLVIRMVIMFSIYWLILSPLTYMAGASNKKIDNITTTVNAAMTEMKKEDEKKYNDLIEKIGWKASSRSSQLGLVKIIRNHPDVIKDEILSEKEYNKIKDDLADVIKADQKVHINYNLFGIDLTDTPTFSFNIFADAQKIWIMPIVAFLAQMLTSYISLLMQKKINPEAPNMASMMLMMPLISLIIGFTLPGGVTFYWACSSLIGGLIQTAVQGLYGPHKMLSRERLKELVTECDFESKQIKKIENAVNGDSTNE